MQFDLEKKWFRVSNLFLPTLHLMYATIPFWSIHKPVVKFLCLFHHPHPTRPPHKFFVVSFAFWSFSRHQAGCLPLVFLTRLTLVIAQCMLMMTGLLPPKGRNCIKYYQCQSYVCTASHQSLIINIQLYKTP